MSYGIEWALREEEFASASGVARGVLRTAGPTGTSDFKWLVSDRGARGEAVQVAEELLAFEGALSGVTSAPYLRAAQTAAGVYQYSGNLEGALALHRQIIAIADLTLSPNDAQRGLVRIGAGFAFANARRFDEAARLANEAVAVGEGMRPPRGELLEPQVEQIRRLIAAEPERASTDGRGRVH